MKAAFWSLGIVLALFGLLYWKGWGPIVKALHDREEKINASLAKAEEVEKAAREIAETNRKTLAEAQVAAQQIVAESRAAAAKAAADIEAKAHAEIESAKDRFQREMALEADKVRAEIRKDAVDLTLAAAAKLLGRSLSPADQRRLAEESLRDAETVVGG
jgi:F-type H+-transporting ATPase subunit b